LLQAYEFLQLTITFQYYMGAKRTTNIHYMHDNQVGLQLLSRNMQATIIQVWKSSWTSFFYWIILAFACFVTMVISSFINIHEVDVKYFVSMVTSTK
jgi:hypothetical protein